MAFKFLDDSVFLDNVKIGMADTPPLNLEVNGVLQIRDDIRIPTSRPPNPPGPQEGSIWIESD